MNSSGRNSDNKASDGENSDSEQSQVDLSKDDEEQKKAVKPMWEQQTEPQVGEQVDEVLSPSSGTDLKV